MGIFVKDSVICLAVVSVLIDVVLGNCGKVLYTDASAHISSPDYPQFYKAGTTCDYEIRRPGEGLRITWNPDFEIAGKMPFCNEDYIEVFVGTNSGKPHPIYTREGCVKVRLFSLSTSSGGKGFQLEYTAKSLSEPFQPSDKSCPSTQNVEHMAATFSSPGWPIGYNLSSLPSPDYACEWYIKAASNKKVKVNIMDVDLYATAGCSGFSDRLIVKEKVTESGDLPQEYTYCLESDPISKQTSFYEVSVELDANPNSPRSTARRGFVVGYITYTDSGFSVIPSVLVIGIMVIVSSGWLTL